MKFNLRVFQQKALTKLRRSFLELWETKNYKLPLIFKAPTGSGKTIMMAQWCHNMAGDPEFNIDKAFVWLSFNEESYVQSKNKFNDFYRGANSVRLLDQNDLNKGKLHNNDIFFINWQKLKTSTDEGRILRKKGERKVTFDEYIYNTQQDGREIVLIIDEAHRDSDTPLAEDIINLINPRIIIKVTATPKEEVQSDDISYVEVDREDVVDAGLIKEKIVVQTKEDLDSANEEDQDRVLLELAYKKRISLLNKYQQSDRKINPLVLIQLPNDDVATLKTGTQNKLEVVKQFLKEYNVSDDEIAIWLSNNKENLDEIEKNDSSVSYLIFKQAAATGWDCPRASILVMFREIKSPIFHTQTVGRILRMPEAEHYKKYNELNVGYLYTNYSRNELKLPDNDKGKNKPFTQSSYRKNDLYLNIDLLSTYMKRIDYGDLTSSFQKVFIETANRYFFIHEDDLFEDVVKKLSDNYLDISKTTFDNSLIIDAEIKSYDNLVDELKKGGNDYNRHISQNDLEKLFNLLCYRILVIQEEQRKKYAPERSWGKIKSSLNVWFKSLLGNNFSTYDIYSIVVNDLLNKESSSVLLEVISEALEEYFPIKEKEIERKSSRTMEQNNEWNIPETLYFTDDYIECNVNKCIVSPFFIKKNEDDPEQGELGSEDELRFAMYLDNASNIKWWHKNGDSGKENFAIPYLDPDESISKPFYVDFIVYFEDGTLGLFDVKKGLTAKDAKYRAEGLYNYIQEENKKGKQLIGGIVTNSGGVWKYNDSERYSYNPRDLSNWKNISSLIR